MNIELDHSTLFLPRDGLVAVRDATGTRVACVSGAHSYHDGTVAQLSQRIRT